MFLIETHMDRDTLHRKYCKEYFKELALKDASDTVDILKGSFLKCASGYFRDI
jgi:hypothetical protein